MRLGLPILLFGLPFFAAGAAPAQPDWSALKEGMAEEAVQALLGPSLLGTSGHGYVLRNYDGGAEVLYVQGKLVGWTPPSPAKLPSGKAAALTGLPRTSEPVATMPAPAPAPLPAAAAPAAREKTPPPESPAPAAPPAPAEPTEADLAAETTQALVSVLQPTRLPAKPPTPARPARRK